MVIENYTCTPVCNLFIYKIVFNQISFTCILLNCIYLNSMRKECSADLYFV